MLGLTWSRRFGAGAILASVLASEVSTQKTSSTGGIVVGGTSFALNGDHVSYRFHVDPNSGDLISDHFGGSVGENVGMHIPEVNGWVGLPGRVRREYPDLGRGDFRIPALQIRQSRGSTVSDMQYQSHHVVQGKPALAGLPATFGSDDEVSTLVVHLYDNYSSVAADLSYSIFPKFDAIVRSVNITNEGQSNITIEKAATMRVRRKVEYGTQGFGSTAGYSSHFHNPFLSLLTPTTTESQGEAWGFSLVYTGSFSVDVEKGSQGFTRAMLGFNPYQLSWPLAPGETLTTPECVSAYSRSGIGGVSRIFHRLYRNSLTKSHFAIETRPVLLNSWEGLAFDYNQSTIYNLAQESSQLGVKLFVLDDGWFGNEYPRVDDKAGLGDWEVNTDRFPEGIASLVDQVTQLKAANSTENLQFGLWFEPEMVNPNSTLYNEHPDWALHSRDYPRTVRRDQLVLNVALPEVQDFMIKSVSNILGNASISYVKWDNNRGIHETGSPDVDHAYMLGLYHVFDVLTTRFPDVLWEGCASGGGRFDPGVLQYFPQIWTSDNTDALERLHIQFGTSLVYPPSSMGAHISAVPNGQTGRTIPIVFRAHVAMMGGSFGLELDPAVMPADEKAVVPELIAMAEKVNPIVVRGDLWRLNLPGESNWPAALFIDEDGSQVVLFAFQIRAMVNSPYPRVRLQGLDPGASYHVGNRGANGTYSGSTLMRMGIQFAFQGDYDSRVLFIEKA
ncbi:alpha-galactosidase 2 [Pseudomassariella vexata]|uniref:Alpha-galactosidase n=1 Tax=Pseudomassariella vexata TaxID=1141098 RepID=A0A1Y2DFV4_9PEZI|nr:alpha-galactosidase 2 [Pseudomassariella vexata]ORY57575.1 alpha-galactosidase 2 [Pseudomassariella vexata]